MVKNGIGNYLSLKNCLRHDSSDPVYKRYFILTSLQLMIDIGFFFSFLFFFSTRMGLDIGFFPSSHFTGGIVRFNQMNWLSSGAASWEGPQGSRLCTISLSCGFCPGCVCGGGILGGGNSPGKGTEM